MKVQKWFRRKWRVIEAEAIIQLMNGNGKYDSAGMEEQFPLDRYGLSSPSDSSIDGKPIGNWPDYSLPSIYSCAMSIKCYQHG